MNGRTKTPWKLDHKIMPKINETYNFVAAHEAFATKYDFDLTKYRDYYTVAMGLLKQ